MILEIKDVVTFTNGVIHSVRKQKFAKTNISYPLVHTRTYGYYLLWSIPVWNVILWADHEKNRTSEKYI